MELRKALTMPFQTASLFFVGTTSLLLTMIFSYSGIFGLPLLCLMAIWQVQFTFTLIDDATNGKLETATASIEMFSPWGDARCWVHPILTYAIALTLILQPEIPRLPVLAACALLFPPSLGAIALSGRALDAINPLALFRMIRGLGIYYPLSVLWLVLCVAAALLVTASGIWMLLQVVALQFLLLLACSFIGGAVYARRLELGFVPLVSPEREEDRAEAARVRQRQKMIDDLYATLRGLEPARAVTIACQWMEQTPQHQLAGDMRAVLDAAAHWPDPRRLAMLLRGLVPKLLSMRQPALAFAAVEAGLTAVPTFTPDQENDAVAIIRYALQTGRKRLAATLLANFTGSAANTGTPGPELQELQARLRNDPATPKQPAS